MVFGTQPHHIQRLGVVRVMGLREGRFADGAWELLYSPFTEGFPNGFSRFDFQRVFSSVLLLNLLGCCSSAPSVLHGVLYPLLPILLVVSAAVGPLFFSVLLQPLRPVGAKLFSVLFSVGPLAFTAFRRNPVEVSSPWPQAKAVQRSQQPTSRTYFVHDVPMIADKRDHLG